MKTHSLNWWKERIGKRIRWRNTRRVTDGRTMPSDQGVSSVILKVEGRNVGFLNDLDWRWIPDIEAEDVDAVLPTDGGDG